MQLVLQRVGDFSGRFLGSNLECGIGTSVVVDADQLDAIDVSVLGTLEILGWVLMQLIYQVSA